MTLIINYIVYYILAILSQQKKTITEHIVIKAILLLDVFKTFYTTEMKTY